MTCPCKNCADRHLSCHGQCEKYKAWAEEKRAANKAITKNKMTDTFIIESILRKKERRN